MTSDLNKTAHKVLDAAEELTQQRGFNAFSFKDLQERVGIKTSSIHYYFSTKQELASALIERYSESFKNQLAIFDQELVNPKQRLIALTDIYRVTLQHGKFCLCGMLCSDMHSLPPSVHAQLDQFFTMLESWIAVTIQQVQTIEKHTKTTDAKTLSVGFLAQLEGALLMARVKKDDRYFEMITQQLLTYSLT